MRADAQGDSHRRPGSLLRQPRGLIGLIGTLAIVLVGATAPLLAPHGPFELVAPPLQSPGGDFPLGSDALGRDMVSQVIHGARSSLLIAAIVAPAVLTIGLLVGLVAGSVGGWVDDLLMRGAEVVQIVPRFFLALVVAALFGPGLVRLALLLGLTSWPTLARMVRSQTLSLIEQDFVTAARAVGASPVRVLCREILPNVVPVALAFLGLVVAQALLVEAGIGFLGLGDPNTVSWGQLAGEAQRYLRVAWWLAFYPGACIAFTVLALNLLGDAVADVMAARR